MSTSKFEEFLQEKDTEVIKIDWNINKNFFIKKIDEFYSQMDTFLEPYKSKMNIKNENSIINEDYIGTYEVKKRILHIKNSYITFTPIGTNLIGTCGRIDMEGINGVVKFVLVPENNNLFKVKTSILSTEQDKKEWQQKQNKITNENKEANKIWKIVTPPPNVYYMDLDRETFFDALMEVING